MSSYPLPALDIRPPQQQESPVEQYGKIMQLKSLMQGQQLQQGQMQLQNQQIQEGQMSLNDRKVIMKAYKQANGDLDKTISLASQNGISNPQTLIGLKKASVEQQLQNISLFQAKGKQAVDEANLMQGAHDTVAKAPAEQRPQVYQQQLQALGQAGLDISKVPPQYPGDEAFSVMGLGLQDHKTQMENLAKEAETNKNTQQAGEAQQNTLLAKAKADWYSKHGMAPGVSPDEAGMADWLQKNPGKGPADYQRYIKTLPINTRYSLENGAGIPGVGNGNGATPQAADVAKKFGMSQTSFDQAAEKYWTTGNLPPIGRGISGIALNRALMNRAGELHPQGSLAQNSAEYKANENALKQLQSNSDQMQAFENTAGKNLDVFLNTAKSVVDFGSPWVNKPMRAIDAGALGSKDQAAFNAGRQTAVNEISRVLNSTKGTGVVSDSARGEVEGLMGPNATLKQLYSAANILRTDMKNRSESYAQQIADIKGRIGGGQGNQQQNTQQHAPGAQANLPEGTTGKGSDNKPYIVKGGVWVPQQ